MRRLAIGGELRAALAGALELHYQPQVNLRSGRVEGVEALMRWPHPRSAGRPDGIHHDRGVHRPDPPAHRVVLGAALSRLLAGASRGLEMRVAVNLSARLLQDTAFPARLERCSRRAAVGARFARTRDHRERDDVDPARALRSSRKSAASASRSRSTTSAAAISSLGYLRDLPVHALKLDKSFVMGMRDSTDDRVIVESTVQMAHALRLEVVAEGVETAWDANFLAMPGYDVGQGYHYSRPMPAARCRTGSSSSGTRTPACAARFWLPPGR